ncbi:male sterility protein-domain-containing protein [Aspergillus californicus]
MGKYDLYPSRLEFVSKIKILEGDITDEYLGLGHEQFTRLTNWASVIFHVAAKVNSIDTYQQHYRHNVVGTKNVLRVATLGSRKSFHYFSSLDIWGPRGYLFGTRHVSEDAPLLPHLKARLYDIGYTQSQ